MYLLQLFEMFRLFSRKNVATNPNKLFTKTFEIYSATLWILDHVIAVFVVRIAIATDIYEHHVYLWRIYLDWPLSLFSKTLHFQESRKSQKQVVFCLRLVVFHVERKYVIKHRMFRTPHFVGTPCIY